MMKKFAITLMMSFSALALTATSASAQSPVLEPQDTREGLAIGVGAGLGHMQCDGIGCDGVTEAGGFNVNLGLMLNPDFAIMGDIWAMGHTEDRMSVAHGMITAGPQVWLADLLWLRGGVGVAQSMFNYDAEIVEISDQSETVPALAAAVGAEVISSEEFALDVQLRAGSGFFNEGDTRVQNVALGMGANWY